jgi:hypothetical protein
VDHTFYTAGGYNCTQSVRDEQTQSWWSCNDGLAMDGLLKGTVLRWHSFLNMTFGEFRALCPEGEVMVYGERDRAWHRDPRHGHGTDYQPGSPGIEPFFLASWIGDSGEPDKRLPENTLLIGINEPEALRVYPLEDVKREGGVVRDVLGGTRPIVIFSPYHAYTMAVYEPFVPGGPGVPPGMDGRELSFSRQGDRFVDAETGSTWTIFGEAESGPLAGQQLQPVQWQWLEWHTFVSAHPRTDIWRSDAPPLRDPTDNPAFVAAVDALETAGFRVEACNWLHPTFRSIAAIDGLALWVRGDPLELLAFEDQSDAADYLLLDRHARGIGNFVIRSNPEEHFSDWAHTRPLREAKIAWSKLLDDGDFLAVLEAALAPYRAKADKRHGIHVLLGRLADAGFPVRTTGSRWNPGRNHDAGRCFEAQVPTRALDGFRAVIDGDCFLVSRFPDASAARAYVIEEGRSAINAGPIALRSDPPGQYRAGYPIMSFNAADDEVKWSRLLTDDTFRGVCAAFEEDTA